MLGYPATAKKENVYGLNVWRKMYGTLQRERNGSTNKQTIGILKNSEKDWNQHYSDRKEIERNILTMTDYEERETKYSGAIHPFELKSF